LERSEGLTGRFSPSARPCAGPRHGLDRITRGRAIPSILSILSHVTSPPPHTARDILNGHLERRDRRTATWALALASVASFMVALDALVVTTALSTIRVSLSASIEELEWTVNAYNLSFAVLLMTGAALGDHLGRRRMFATGLAVFTAAPRHVRQPQAWSGC